MAGRYLLEYVLGKGGMADVWAATDTKLGRNVAVKMLKPECSDRGNTRIRFGREARTIARLNSPHVVAIHDYGIHREKAFMVMELLHGQHFGTRLRQRTPWSLACLRPFVKQVAKGLACAHDAGVTHRDLKPSNVFVANVGREEVIKLIDFGIAKPPHDVEVTADGTLIGTPGYMSPEQVDGQSTIDHRSDLWSFGVIVYYALTARRPFSRAGRGAQFAQACMGYFQPASSLCPWLPRSVDAFLEKALAPERAARFQSAREMALSFYEIG